MLDWSIEWLINSLVVWWSVDRLVARVVARVIPKSSENQPKIFQKSIKNLSKMVPKSIKIGSQSCLGGVLGHLGPKMAPRWPQEPPKPRKSIFGPPSWGPFWEPKLIKIGFKSDPKGDRFYDRFEDRFLERLGANLSPSWPPKPFQNGTKFAPKSMQVGVLIWELFLEGCWLNFHWFFTTIWHGRSSKNLKKPIVFLMFFNFWLLCCWDGLLIDFWLIFGRFWGRKSTKNRLKINQKRYQK